MHDSDRFLYLYEAYKTLAKTAHKNLDVIGGQQKKGALQKLFAKSALDRMKPFNLAPAKNGLSSNSEGMSNTLILGELDEKMSFYPSITEKILNIHSVANFVNAALQTKKVSSEQVLVQPLQEALLDFYFLSNTFNYYAHKALLVDGKLENMVSKKPELEELVNSYYGWFVNGLNDLIKPCIDLAHLNVKLKRYVFKGYAYLTYDVGDDGKVVNDYFLPKEYWEPYLRYAAAEQAKAMKR